MNIVIVTVSPDLLETLIHACDSINDQHPDVCQLALFNASIPPTQDDASRLVDAASGADFIAVDLNGADQRWADILAEPLSSFAGHVLPTGRLFTEFLHIGSLRAAPGMGAVGPAGSSTPQAASGTAEEQRQHDLDNLSLLLKLFHNTTPARAEQLLTTLLHYYGGHAEVTPTEA